VATQPIGDHQGVPGNRRPLPWWLEAFCWCVMWLDLIPRYGRYYRWTGVVDEGEHRRTWDGPHWSFQRYGHWGMNVLIRLGLFWRYTDGKWVEYPDGD
jgi:hypothetical protein